MNLQVNILCHHLRVAPGTDITTAIIISLLFIVMVSFALFFGDSGFMGHFQVTVLYQHLCAGPGTNITVSVVVHVGGGVHSIYCGSVDHFQVTNLQCHL